MQFQEFVDLSRVFWEEHLHRVSELNASGAFGATRLTFLYPSILLCTEVPEFFVLELMGARPTFDGLAVKTHKDTSINRYFYQFDDDTPDPAVLFEGYMNEFIGLQFTHPRDDEELHKRFPFLKRWTEPGAEEPIIVAGANPTGAAVAFGKAADLISFQNCVLVNTYLRAMRVKHIQLATVIRQEHSGDRYKRYLDTFRLAPKREIYGVHYCEPGTEAKYHLAAQLANVFLFQDLRETTLGAFLRDHPEILESALCARRVVYEPYLAWIEGFSAPDDVAINPDLLVQRPDRHYDIYDLKRPLLDKKGLTKGDRSRRRFVDYVEEGAAQLAYYAEYFSYPANRKYALDTYGITVSDPRLVLIVGTSENLNREHVAQACRKLKNLEIIDYDTVLHSFLNSTCPAA